MQYKTLLTAATAVGLTYAQNNATQNLTAALSGSSELSALAGLLNQYPDFTAQVANLTNVTLLAPNNNAIQALISSDNAGALNDPAAVQALLSYHILQQPIYASNASSTPLFAATMLNDTAYANVTGGQVVEIVESDNNVVVYSGYKNNATVVTANVNYTGGVIHIIDSVLTIPGSIVDVGVVAGLTDFVGAVIEANLTDAVLALNTSTFFCPTNDAFSAIGSALGNLTTDQLTQILEYHIINGTAAYSSTLINTTVATLQGGDVNVTITDGAVFINSARVVVADILVANGVAHVIDSVLNPNNTNVTADASASATGVYSGASSSSVDLTSGVPSATTSANAALTSQDSQVADGYSQTSTPSNIGENPAGATTTSSSAMAAMATGAMGAAALFGAGAFMANL